MAETPSAISPHISIIIPAFNEEKILKSTLDATKNAIPRDETFEIIVVDDFLIERGQKLRKKDFVVVTDFMMRLKMGKRIHLCEYEVDSLAEGLVDLFNREVEIPRIRHGKRQTLDTLITEEALLLAKYLRNEQNSWIPRIPLTNS